MVILIDDIGPVNSFTRQCISAITEGTNTQNASFSDVNGAVNLVVERIGHVAIRRVVRGGIGRSSHRYGIGSTVPT